ncbi:hypothetical protein [Halomarina oriensis]|uniref:Uncharacterized protein n=1 Tax=Halomarina oriensis TaxID=671145 RepID=A0A6B0GNT5_9EURY|nr:hypothetical protein [Halomarina oriensis]MWG36586.1 hypothetical protein [Halomarina oriensis]
MTIQKIQLRGSPLTDVGGVEVFGNVAEDAQASQSVPERKVDSNYTWGTRVGPDPKTLTIEAWCDDATQSALVALTERAEPVSVVGATLSLPSAAVTSVAPSTTGKTPGSWNTTIDITEIQQGGLSGRGFGDSGGSSAGRAPDGRPSAGASQPFQPL